VSSAGIYNVYERMHKMRAKLYTNYLPKGGPYIARTANEASVTVEDICAAMKNRGGYEGSYEDALQTIRHFHKEAQYQLADGFSVNLGICSIHPNINGTFDNDTDSYDPKKNPVTFRCQALTPLRKLSDSIEVIIEGLADTNGYIDRYVNQDTHIVNDSFFSSGLFTVHGSKIKIEGDDPSVGLYFIPDNDPSKAVKVTRIAENTPTKITGISPVVAGDKIKVEVRTQFTGASNILLKTPRTITGGFELEQA